jgi:RNA polymerase sigma-70 factor, ECF subfamily
MVISPVEWQPRYPNLARFQKSVSILPETSQDGQGFKRSCYIQKVISRLHCFYVTLLVPPPVYRVMKSIWATPMADESAADSTTIDFEMLMLQEQRRIYLLCLRFLRDSDEADSAAQDTFIKAFRILQRSNGNGIREPAKWLTRVAVNNCINRLNSGRWLFWRRRISADNEQTLLQLVPAAGLSQEEVLIRREKMKKLSQSLRKLSARQRMVFVMRHDEGRSLNEIAEALDLDLGTVKAHMARAVRKLREELRDLYAR